MTRIQISGGLYASCLCVMIFTGPMLLLPTQLIHAAGQEGWLAAIGGGCVGLAAALIGVVASARHPGMEPAEIARTVLGDLPGRLFGTLYAASALLVFSRGLQEVYNFTSIALLTRTPALVLIGSAVLVVLYGVWLGLEPVVRVSFQALIALGAAHLMVVLVMREVNVLQREPFLYRGIGSVLQGTVQAAGWFTDAILGMTLAAHLKRPQEAVRWTVIAVVGGVIGVAKVTLEIALTFGPDVPTRLLFPIYEMAQLLALSSAVERFEVLMVIVWLSGMIVRLSLALYASASAAATAFGFKSHRYVAVVLAGVGTILLRLWSTPLDFVQWRTSGTAAILNLAAGFGLTLVLLLGSLLHQRAKGRRGVGA